MTRRDDLLSAIDSDDAAAATSILATEPDLANARDANGVSVVLRARYRSARSVLDAILAFDPELDIHDASALGYVDRIRAHLDDDPRLVSALSVDGFTPLHLAAFFGKDQAARLLLGAGARVDAVTTNEMANQPLHAAAAGRHIEICRLLVAAGAPVDVAEHGGYTPLHQAAQHGDLALIELLLSAGAPTDARDDAGRHPADLARAAGHDDAANRLDDAGAPTPQNPR